MRRQVESVAGRVRKQPEVVAGTLDQRTTPAGPRGVHHPTRRRLRAVELELLPLMGDRFEPRGCRVWVPNGLGFGVQRLELEPVAGIEELLDAFVDPALQFGSGLRRRDDLGQSIDAHAQRLRLVAKLRLEATQLLPFSLQITTRFGNLLTESAPGLVVARLLVPEFVQLLDRPVSRAAVFGGQERQEGGQLCFELHDPCLRDRGLGLDVTPDRVLGYRERGLRPQADEPTGTTNEPLLRSPRQCSTRPESLTAGLGCDGPWERARQRVRPPEEPQPPPRRPCPAAILRAEA